MAVNIKVKTGRAEKEPAEALVFYLCEDTDITLSGKGLVSCDNALNKVISDLITRKEFVAKLCRTIILPTYGNIPAKRIMLVGLGKKKELTLEKIRKAAGVTTSTLRDRGIREATPVMDSIEILTGSTTEYYQAYIEGGLLSLYQFQKYKSAPPEDKKDFKSISLLIPNKSDLPAARKAVKNGQIIADAVYFTRDLVNTPSQDKTPAILATVARKLAKEVGIHCRILSLPELKRLKMGGLLGVAQGSEQPPCFIIIEYNPEKKSGETILFVGKGITFDSGGICLKPAKNLDQMKTDMAGGAAVMGAIKAIASMKLPHRIIGLIPCAENMPSGSAFKPGDIIRLYSGKTSEITNTDAEGRLILADALGYAETYKPDAVVDIATLTGSCRVALGNIATGMLGNNENLKEKIKAAGERSGERVWELPLWEEYYEQIKSDIADMKNTGGPYAGTITATCFLSKFTEKYPWVHLDIAGTSWYEKNESYIPKGASGVGVRLLVQLVRNWTHIPQDRKKV